jgi:hypothetical protein
MNAKFSDFPTSHAVYGLWMIGVGSSILALSLLIMKFGVTLYYRGKPMPLEIFAGLAGIIIAIEVVHLVIALVGKLRAKR